MINNFYNTDIQKIIEIDRSSSQSPWNRSLLETYSMKSEESMSYTYKSNDIIVGFLMSKIVREDIHLHNIVVKKSYRKKI